MNIKWNREIWKWVPLNYNLQIYIAIITCYQNRSCGHSKQDYAQRKEKGDKQTKRDKEPHYGVVSITKEERIKHSRNKDHSAKKLAKKDTNIEQKKDTNRTVHPFILY